MKDNTGKWKITIDDKFCAWEFVFRGSDHFSIADIKKVIERGMNFEIIRSTLVRDWNGKQETFE